MTLNLSAPPNFKGLNQYLPVRRYERHLPHWRQDGATYFATFNLADAIPANKQREIESIRRDWEHKHPPPRDDQGWKEYAKRVHHLVERVLDSSINAKVPVALYGRKKAMTGSFGTKSTSMESFSTLVPIQSKPNCRRRSGIDGSIRNGKMRDGNLTI